MRTLLLSKNFKRAVRNTLLTGETIDIYDCFTGEILKHFEPSTDNLFLEGLFIAEFDKQQYTLQELYIILKDYILQDCYVYIGNYHYCNKLIKIRE